MCAVLVWCLGCMTSSDGERLRRDVDRLKRQLAHKSRQSDAARERLQQVMEQATSLLTRNNADVGVQVERIQAELAKQVGMMDELTNTTRDIDRRLSTLEAKVDVRLEGTAGTQQPGQPEQNPVPTNPTELYKSATSKISGGAHEEGRRLLRHFIARFPRDQRVAQAQIALGDSYFTQQKFAPAIQEYRKVIERYKKSPVVPAALYKIGLSFYQLKFCSDAELFLRELVKGHPRSRQIKPAKRMLNLIKRYRHNKRVCSS